MRSPAADKWTQGVNSLKNKMHILKIKRRENCIRPPRGGVKDTRQRPVLEKGGGGSNATNTMSLRNSYRLRTGPRVNNDLAKEIRNRILRHSSRRATRGHKQTPRTIDKLKSPRNILTARNRLDTIKDPQVGQPRSPPETKPKRSEEGNAPQSLF